MIDESGVLDNTKGTVTEKVEKVLNYANFKNIIQEALYNAEGSGSYNRLSIFRNTNIDDVSMFDFSKVQNMQAAFFDCQKLIEANNIDMGNAIYASSMFQNCSKLKSVKIKNMSSKITSVLNMFHKCESLESVETLDFSGCTNLGTNFSNYVFTDCKALKEIRLVENCIKVSLYFGSSLLLSNESIQNIVNALETVETTQTLTLHADIVLTDEQKSTINSKGWTLVQ